MKKSKPILITICCVLACLTTFGQCYMDSLSVTYCNGFNHLSQPIEELRIVNNTEEDYLTWVSTEPIQGKSNAFLAHKYFISRKGDFSLLDFMTHNEAFDMSTIIGFSFIKKIPAKESFSYIIPVRADNVMFYKSRIVIISRQEIEQMLHGFHIEEKYFYPLSCVVLFEDIIGTE